MDGFGHPWFILGGWAIDLFIGRVTRAHSDREIGIFRHHQQEFRRHIGDKALFKAITGPDGGMWVEWKEQEYIELPLHQILIRPKGAEVPVGDWQAMPEEFEIFLNEADGGLWRFRRNPAITRPASEIIMQSESGLPILTPEIQLLYKAKHHRAKDELDFTAMLPLLNDVQRTWLKSALEKTHPGDRWVGLL